MMLIMDMLIKLQMLGERAEMRSLVNTIAFKNMSWFLVSALPLYTDPCEGIPNLPRSQGYGEYWNLSQVVV